MYQECREEVEIREIKWATFMLQLYGFLKYEKVLNLPIGELTREQPLDFYSPCVSGGEEGTVGGGEGGTGGLRAHLKICFTHKT